ncbi:MAG: hypothetical protein M1823_006250 [Watsoniomyces obsoletus]|nr:MAG: hypothetical protein M1823_006250 [Watsoniomyces obsoletus]
MATSSTAIPDVNPAGRGRGEQEPLLGRPGDAAQPEGRGIQFNFILGTAVIAQAGIWILAAVVWAGIFTHPLILFSAHPLLNSAGILLLTQGALVLQPTHTPEQKRLGAHIHGALNSVGTACLTAGLIVVIYTKFAHHGDHFQSVHAILGLITAIFLVVQALVGVTQFYTPSLYGGVNNAKKIYKYHRMSGYVVLVMALATVAAATQTDYNQGVLHIRLWAVLVAAVLVLAGVVPRIKKQKIGL